MWGNGQVGGCRSRPVDLALLAKKDGPAREDATEVRRALRAAKVPFRDVKDAAKARDVLVVVGDSSYVLDAARTATEGVAVLGVGTGAAFLAEVTAAQFPAAARRLAAGDYRIESVDRMACSVAGRLRGLALNEAALLAATSGQIVRYSLAVDDELLWRDRGDGVIVATPTGSTAYALSAGGPIVLSDAGALSVVPVCSSEDAKPLVVRQGARIRLSDVGARGGVDLVLDGRERSRVASGDEVELARAEVPARFLRFTDKRASAVVGKLKAEKDTATELGRGPPSAKFVHKLLLYEGALTQQEIVRTSQLGERTVRNALTWLVKEGIVAKEPSFRDARQDVYNLVERAGRPRRPPGHGRLESP